MTIRLALATEQKYWVGRIEAASREDAATQLMDHVKKIKDDNFEKMEVTCSFKVGEVVKKSYC